MRGFQWRRGTLVLALLGILVVSAVLSWPAAAQAQPRLLVSDVSRVSDDEQLLFAALQGLVNRPALRKDPRRPPRIYLVGLRNGGDRTPDPTAETWLRDIVSLPTLRVSPYSLLQRFRSKARGLVVWDPALAIDTQNVARPWRRSWNARRTGCAWPPTSGGSTSSPARRRTTGRSLTWVHPGGSASSPGSAIAAGARDSTGSATWSWPGGGSPSRPTRSRSGSSRRGSWTPSPTARPSSATRSSTRASTTTTACR